MFYLTFEQNLFSISYLLSWLLEPVILHDGQKDNFDELLTCKWRFNTFLCFFFQLELLKLLVKHIHRVVLIFNCPLNKLCFLPKQQWVLSLGKNLLQFGNVREFLCLISVFVYSQLLKTMLQRIKLKLKLSCVLLLNWQPRNFLGWLLIEILKCFF